MVQCLYALQPPEIYISWLKACFTTTSYSVCINGILHGFFKGTRGLRQVDPLSPYLFGLVMNILSQKLNDAAMDGKFYYHPKCKKSELTHLCFADDLLIFSDGSPHSICGILTVLQEFHQMSGLAISPERSCFFACGLKMEELTTIASISGFPQRTLPIRYMGLPLCTKKLSILNCEPLLQSIKSKINSWTANLSFAGRQVLISTVIAGIINFWCSAFVLPMECISQIESMCGAYIWKGSLEGR